MRLLQTQSEDRCILSGTAEELEGLADMLRMKARMGRNYQATYTGIMGLLMEIELLPDPGREITFGG